MSELTTLARPYAVAVYQRAKDTDTTDKWAAELAFLSAVMSDERLQRAVANPRVRRESLAKAFLALCEGRLDAEGQNFVRLLIQNQRLELVGEIEAGFAEYRANDEGYIEVAMVSAYDLSGEEQQALAETLSAALGKRARLTTTVDDSLIGGVYIRAGDRVIDASVRGQIERLEKSLWN